MLRSLIAAITARLRRAARLRRHRGPGPSSPARTLAAERTGHFFSWFHLDPLGDPVPASSGRTWHCFRPDGAAFRAFVELDVLIDASGRILQSRLGLDRAFADHPRNGIFARDLVKSYLQWGLAEASAGEARTLIENIGHPAAAGVPVLIRRDSVPPTPGEDTTGGYLAYLGRRASAQAVFGNSKLTIANLNGAFPEREIFAADIGTNAGTDTPRPNAHRAAQRPSWLRLDIAPAITYH
jgi:hypothetical protein